MTSHVPGYATSTFGLVDGRWYVTAHPWGRVVGVVKDTSRRVVR